MKLVFLVVTSALTLSNAAHAKSEHAIEKITIEMENKDSIASVPQVLKTAWPEINDEFNAPFSPLYHSNFKVGDTEYIFSAFGGRGEWCDSGPNSSTVEEDYPLRCDARLINTSTSDIKIIENVCIEIHYGDNGPIMISKLSVDEEKKMARIVNETKSFAGGACTNVFLIN